MTTSIEYTPAGRFRCEPYECAMTAASCLHRQKLARAGDERFKACRSCKVGRRVAREAGGEAAPKCGHEGCKRAASPIHESGLCLLHEREDEARCAQATASKVEREEREKKMSEEAITIASAQIETAIRQEEKSEIVESAIARPECEWAGCDRPRSLKPTELEGGESLCGRHRGVIASAKAKAARKAVPVAVPQPAPLPDVPTEPAPVETHKLTAETHKLPSEAHKVEPSPRIALSISVPEIPMPTSLPSVPTEPMVITDAPIPRRLTGPELELSEATSEALSSIKPLLDTVKPWLRVYVAAPTVEVMRAREVASQLRAIVGVEVMSKWHDIIEEGAEEPTNFTGLKEILDANLPDLMPSDIVVALTRTGKGAGVYGEIGRALALKKTVYWSVEFGGTSQDYGDEDHVIASPTDADVVRAIRNVSRIWRRVA